MNRSEIIETARLYFCEVLNVPINCFGLIYTNKGSYFDFSVSLGCAGYNIAIHRNNPELPLLIRVEIDRNFSILNLLHTLAHELCHVKQYYNKELVYIDTKGNSSTWLYKGKLINDCDVIWEERPYEIEANQFADKHVKLFLEKYYSSFNWFNKLSLIITRWLVK